MRPQLVEYEKIFKKKQVNEVKNIPKQPKIHEKQMNNFNFFMNSIGVIILIVGFGILYYRKTNKEENKWKYNQRVIQLYHDIN